MAGTAARIMCAEHSAWSEGGRANVHGRGARLKHCIMPLVQMACRHKAAATSWQLSAHCSTTGDAPRTAPLAPRRGMSVSGDLVRLCPEQLLDDFSAALLM
eukprot:TRINITY_DN29419_c0_g1_i1.p3 TRINITY_DN29419_c0_g1~~TRINITY_DN29419_c0_g1_i1.p3  ORF type:complete len:101 (+),score=14.62 TRINITY_DN29419_c0_g1_i1:232-534(+)